MAIRAASPLPPDSQYVVVSPEGQLTVGGVRQRFWAAIGKVQIDAQISQADSAEVRAKKIESSRKGTDAILDHLEWNGFSAVRFWRALGGSKDYEIGDGSGADCVDYFIAEAKKRGFRIWAAGPGNSTGFPSPDDVNILNDPATAEAWKTALAATLEKDGSKTPLDLRHNIARVWDPRLEALVIERMRGNADHFNKYTGLRWADDPVFAVWELTNEEWWMRKMVGGQWQNLPDFFRNELFTRWNSFLQRKYGSHQSLEKAWGGLLPGESLHAGSILFAPVADKTNAALAMNDANEEARASLAAIGSEHRRADFSAARASDVLEFLTELQFDHKRRLADAFKSFGKSTRLSPLVYDTGIGYEIQSQFLHQNSDAVAHDAYVNGWGPRFEEPVPNAPPKFPHEEMLRTLDAERISANVGPWVNWLLKPPGITQGVPWLEHNRVEGKPFLVYETQI